MVVAIYRRVDLVTGGKPTGGKPTIAAQLKKQVFILNCHTTLKISGPYYHLSLLWVRVYVVLALASYSFR